MIEDIIKILEVGSRLGLTELFMGTIVIFIVLFKNYKVPLLNISHGKYNNDQPISCDLVLKIYDTITNHKNKVSDLDRNSIREFKSKLVRSIIRSYYKNKNNTFIKSKTESIMEIFDLYYDSNYPPENIIRDIYNNLK